MVRGESAQRKRALDLKFRHLRMPLYDSLQNRLHEQLALMAEVQLFTVKVWHYNQLHDRLRKLIVSSSKKEEDVLKWLFGSVSN